MTMDTQDKIKQQVTGNPVVLYMKGTPQMPQCGFSAMAIQVLQACGVPSPFTVNLYENVQRLKLNVDQMVHVHGGMDPFAKLVEAASQRGTN